MSRNAATVKVAEAAGYDRVADLWRRIGAGTAPRAFPSIALGVFEATPHDIASVYRIFANGGGRSILTAPEAPVPLIDRIRSFMASPQGRRLTEQGKRYASDPRRQQQARGLLARFRRPR